MNQSDRQKGHVIGLARRRGIAENRAKKAKEMVDQGLSPKRIAEIFGVAKRTIQKDLRK